MNYGFLDRQQGGFFHAKYFCPRNLEEIVLRKWNCKIGFLDINGGYKSMVRKHISEISLMQDFKELFEEVKDGKL